MKSKASSREERSSEGRFAYEGLDRVIHERARLSVLTSLITNPRGLTLFRLIIASVGQEPDLARTVFSAGARASRIRLAEFLALEARAGRLAIADPDEAADLLGDLTDARSEELLEHMEPEDAADVKELLAYGEETAGGLMTIHHATRA